MAQHRCSKIFMEGKERRKWKGEVGRGERGEDRREGREEVGWREEGGLISESILYPC